MRLRVGLAALLLGCALPAASVPPVCAGEGPRAALVIDAGNEGPVTTYCVALDREPVSGIDLIVLAGKQHGLHYALGSGGRAVCMLEGVGAAAGDCFGKYPDYWGYWRGSAGGWTWSPVGAGSSEVRDGDVDGWSWGSGDDGSTHPPPPVTGWGGVCPPQRKVAPSPRATAAPVATQEPTETQAPGPPSREPADAASRRMRAVAVGGRGVFPDPTPSRNPARERASPAVARSRGPGGTGGVVALATAVVLGAGALVVARRRKKTVTR